MNEISALIFDSPEEERIVSDLAIYCGNRRFQSYRALRSCGIKRVIEFIIKAMNKATDEIHDGRRTHVRECVLKMIMNEINLIPQEMHSSLPPTHYVFYRLVNRQIVLYELNTCILERILGFRRSDPSAIMCIPYLNEGIYADDLHRHMEWIRKGNSDVCGDYSGSEEEEGIYRDFNLTMLCVNNCLNPSVNHREFNRFLQDFDAEADPLKQFSEGYEAGSNSESAMVSSLITVYEITEEEAKAIVREIIMTHYESLRTKGHCIQIFIPNTLKGMDKYVYLSVAYGYPVTVYSDCEGKHFAHKMFEAKCIGSKAIAKQREMEEMKATCDIVSMREVLSSPDMSYLQARIIGHPNLFLKDNAYAKFLSSDPSFTLDKLNIMQLLDRLKPRDDRSWTKYRKFY